MEILTRHYRFPLCTHEGNLREYGFGLESYELLEIWVENMWRP